MAHASVVAVVGARIGTAWVPNGWTGAPLPVIGPNTGTTPPADGSPFVELQFPVAKEDHVGMAGVGNRTFREDGAFRIVLAYPKGAGSEEAVQWLDEIRNLFRAKQFFGVTTYSPSPAVENDANDDGNFYVLSTSVPYHFDFQA